MLDNYEESKDYLQVERIEKDLIWLSGHNQPFKGCPTEERVIVANMLKKLATWQIEGVKEAFDYVIRYDWAYRVRFLDMCNETSTTRLRHNPRKEVKRLLFLYREREVMPEVYEKVEKLIKILRFLLLFPRFKRFFVECAKDLPKPDESDLYWAAKKVDYRFGGINRPA